MPFYILCDIIYARKAEIERRKYNVFSNQKILITGNLSHQGDLESALKYILDKEYDAECNSQYRYPDVFQVTPDGKYVLGRTYGKDERGWTRFPFEATIDILGPIIRQHLLKQKFPPCEGGDGGEKKGYLIKIEDCGWHSPERNGIIEPCRAIFTIEPFTCYYSK